MDKDVIFDENFSDDIILISLDEIYLTDKRIIFLSPGLVGEGNSNIKDYLNYEDVIHVDFKYRYRNGLFSLSLLVGLLALITNPETVFMIIALLTSLCGLIVWRWFGIPYLNILAKNVADPEVYIIPLSKMDNTGINRLVNMITELISIP